MKTSACCDIPTSLKRTIDACVSFVLAQEARNEGIARTGSINWIDLSGLQKYAGFFIKCE